MTTSHTNTTSTIHRKLGFVGGAVALVACFAFSACEEDTNSVHPARDDIDAGWTCSIEPGLVRASGTITNHSSKTSFYIVETEFRLDGRPVDHRSATIDEVAPGETARVETVSSDVVDADVTCHVKSIDRFKA